MALTRKKLSAHRPRKTRMIHVPAWSDGGDDEVCIAVLTGRDMAELMALTAQEQSFSAEYVLEFTARAVVDAETHERIFAGPEGVAALAALPGDGLQAVFNAAATFNRMGDDQAKEMAKNSKGTAGGASGSGSPSTPASLTRAS